MTYCPEALQELEAWLPSHISQVCPHLLLVLGDKGKGLGTEMAVHNPSLLYTKHFACVYGVGWHFYFTVPETQGPADEMTHGPKVIH